MNEIILDIHTHHEFPAPLALISVSPVDFSPAEGQSYSVGIHPWAIPDNPPGEEAFALLSEAAAKPCVRAIGECGIDMLKGGTLFRQLNIFKFHVDLSEKLAKPLVIHEVKAHDQITGLRRDLKPSQNWAIHGFRAKPSVAKMMAELGIYLSFSEKFNPESLLFMLQNYPDLILAETDESSLPIAEIISHLSAAIGNDLLSLIEKNTATFLHA